MFGDEGGKRLEEEHGEVEEQGVGGSEFDNGRNEDGLDRIFRMKSS